MDLPGPCNADVLECKQVIGDEAQKQFVWIGSLLNPNGFSKRIHEMWQWAVTFEIPPSLLINYFKGNKNKQDMQIARGPFCPPHTYLWGMDGSGPLGQWGMTIIFQVGLLISLMHWFWAAGFQKMKCMPEFPYKHSLSVNAFGFMAQI